MAVTATPDGAGFSANLTVAPGTQRAFAVLAASGALESRLSAVSNVVVAGVRGWPPAVLPRGPRQHSSWEVEG